MTALSTAPVEEILGWSDGDPQPHDLTQCWDSVGLLWTCENGLWDLDPWEQGVSWHHLTQIYGPVTRYRPVSDEQYAEITGAVA